MDLIKKLTGLVRNERTSEGALIRAASLIIPMHADIIAEEEESLGTQKPEAEPAVQDKPKPKLFSLKAI